MRLSCLVVLCFLCFAVSEALRPVRKHNTNPKFRYVVYPGLDAHPDEVGVWGNGYASLWNVFFGPKPYVIGWVGEEEDDDELVANDGPVVSGEEVANKRNNTNTNSIGNNNSNNRTSAAVTL